MCQINYFRVRARDKLGNLSAYDCERLTTMEVANCSDRIKNQDETETDSGGSLCSLCANCVNQPKYATTDRICTKAWPAGDGYKLENNSNTRSCDVIEVCNPSLDQDVVDALICCENANYNGQLTGTYAVVKVAWR